MEMKSPAAPRGRRCRAEKRSHLIILDDMGNYIQGSMTTFMLSSVMLVLMAVS